MSTSGDFRGFLWQSHLQGHTVLGGELGEGGTQQDHPLQPTAPADVHLLQGGVALHAQLLQRAATRDEAAQLPGGLHQRPEGCRVQALPLRQSDS